MASSVIPDPTSDLKWDDFKGPIFDYLIKNAQEDPERPCVTETGGHGEARRVFTYKQINEASNVVAHHLIASGVQRNEVCMIYAHRGVDLVIAIMGVLKAGATFSVIDIQYPPDRQNIYLDVARPRALIVIEKAAEHTGGLHSKVTTWIAENLDLRTTIPALKLLNDGNVQGGTLDSGDILESSQSKKSTSPGVIVGPDSTPTLSFTSGSEGKPKGVKGRHFSLTHYFPWMRERFGLSKDERFTMLSGIAHDPIQRDIFTPLFLGAQLFVPHQDDIQNEKLAEWMREHKCTVTHLTPAMGQILVGGALAKFPSLRNAFFVGDVLIKRDVRRLQDLAENVTIINMFGTTETQRAVSYFAVPSRNENPNFLETVGDKIPAGRGMNNVQLLVVDRQNPQRICNVGEEGEIYVRAAGLAEGYLGLDEFTAQKFITSWFVSPEKWIDEDAARQKTAGESLPWREYYKGPRDRLYRSGDLGMYMESGDVRVVGRADDQVKIRGFRIELGEIDTHLSQHPLVRENVTLVRKGDDPILVSYIVPELSKWPAWLQEKGVSEDAEDPSSSEMFNRIKRFRHLLEDTTRHIADKMPHYAVPSVIVPLLKMPLNPNGKVDKPALPFPSADEQRAVRPPKPTVDLSTLSETEIKVNEIISKVLDIPNNELQPEENIFDLGIHSLSAQRILFHTREKFGKQISIPVRTIYSHPTVKSFAKEIDRVTSSGVLADQPDASADSYSKDLKAQISQLPASFATATVPAGQAKTILVTGATGFLGTFLLQNILSRTQTQEPIKVIAHVRAKTEADGLQRIINSCKAYGLWSECWLAHLETVVGDLERPKLGLEPETWERLSKSVDIIIHNGARVHWVDSYEQLKASNVDSTVAVLQLAASGDTPKTVSFISSTSALDTDHYVQLSQKSLASGEAGVPEEDDMQGSATGLGTGYGQTKWVGEQLMYEAGRRGLKGTVVRPGYITGEPDTGSTITDDFLVRMLKGCVQLSARPKMQSNINAVPVTQVAAIISAASLHPPSNAVRTCQVTGHPRLLWTQFLGSLETFGYQVPEVEYRQWADALEKHVADGHQHELEPLLIFATTDLPNDTIAPELDDKNTVAVLAQDEASSPSGREARLGLSEDIVGRYISYLVKLGWMPAPTHKGAKPLPTVKITDEQRQALKELGGRGGQMRPS